MRTAAPLPSGAPTCQPHPRRVLVFKVHVRLDPRSRRSRPPGPRRRVPAVAVGGLRSRPKPLRNPGAVDGLRIDHLDLVFSYPRGHSPLHRGRRLGRDTHTGVAHVHPGRVAALLSKSVMRPVTLPPAPKQGPWAPEASQPASGDTSGVGPDRGAPAGRPLYPLVLVTKRSAGQRTRVLISIPHLSAPRLFSSKSTPDKNNLLDQCGKKKRFM